MLNREIKETPAIRNKKKKKNEKKTNTKRLHYLQKLSGYTDEHWCLRGGSIATLALFADVDPGGRSEGELLSVVWM